MCGVDSASLYLRAVSVEGQDIVCEAQNDAALEGTLTVRVGYGGRGAGCVVVAWVGLRGPSCRAPSCSMGMQEVHVGVL